MRIEFHNLSEGQTLGPLAYDGDVVLTVYSGVFQLKSGSTIRSLRELDQVVVAEGNRFELVCESEGAIQLIWAPAMARTNRG